MDQRQNLLGALTSEGHLISERDGPSGPSGAIGRELLELLELLERA